MLKKKKLISNLLTRVLRGLGIQVSDVEAITNSLIDELHQEFNPKDPSNGDQVLVGLFFPEDPEPTDESGYKHFIYWECNGELKKSDTLNLLWEEIEGHLPKELFAEYCLDIIADILNIQQFSWWTGNKLESKAKYAEEFISHYVSHGVN